MVDKAKLEFSEWKVNLNLHRVYFHSGLKHLENARKNYVPLDDIINRILKIDKKIVKIEARYENKIDAYDKVERFAIQLDSMYSEMQEKYLPVIRDIALVHILNALCLEAYINLLAVDRIEPRSSFDEFDKLNLEGKWLFYPKLIGKKDTFDRGEEPFQGFTRLIRWRNNLVHFKGKSDPWRGFLPPQFFDELGLTLPCAEKSCNCTQNMIKGLVRYCSLPEPKWIKERTGYAFDME